MYTQCPDCDIAFKVTADVLRQAAGKVRCGGCGNAFNALDFLSEQMPNWRAPKETGAALPELTPEIIDTDSRPPRSISAEQSAALLKTLDELAGSDIIIEDTGVEWRVHDDEEAAAPDEDDSDDAPPTADDDAGQEPRFIAVDEYLDDDPTPIDEFLTATPDIIDSPEIFDNVDSGPTRTSVDELRFDDDTPLPDDFDLDDESSHLAEPSADPAAAEDEKPDFEEPHAAEPPSDFALSEPDEWADILGEFQELVADVAAPVDELADDEFAVGAIQPDVAVAADEDPLAEFGTVKEPMDVDSQFALQAEAMGIDLSGIHEVEEDVGDEGENEDDFDPEDVLAAEPEIEDDADVLPDLEIDAREEDAAEEDDLESGDEPEDEAASEAPLEQLDLVDELDDDEPEDLIDEPIVESHTIEEELAALDGGAIEDDASSDPSPSEHYVPPMSEEEHTVNMQIDQDLMALAIEDEDGFASTIVMADKDAEKMVFKRRNGPDDDTGETAEDDSGSQTGFESIIMEGEFVRSILDDENPTSDSATAEEIRKLIDANDAAEISEPGGKRYGLIAGVVLLVLVLAVQAIHQSREALATMPAFSSTIAQVYRALGQPVQPAWDITGWRFEVTNDRTERTEAGDELLTISSRIGNKSDNPLPYPLINISLRDRFEETLGSSVLEPVDYLPEDLDPREHVKPGNSFNAVISLTALSAEATGYKLNVCYRQKDSQLRCNFEDFK